MIIWFLISICVFIISLFLALRSMKGYRERPHHFSKDYSVYLIQNPRALNGDLLLQLRSYLVKNNLILSFEKLYKGQKSALLVYLPSVLLDLCKPLQLLELEDYTQKYTQGDILVWEMGTKGEVVGTLDLSNAQKTLQDQEQLWWQMILQPKENSDKFQSIIRVLAVSHSSQRVHQIQQSVLEETQSKEIILVPKPYSNAQLIKFYRERAAGSYLMDGNILTVDIQQVLNLLS